MGERDVPGGSLVRSLVTVFAHEAAVGLVMGQVVVITLYGPGKVHLATLNVMFHWEATLGTEETLFVELLDDPLGSDVLVQVSAESSNGILFAVGGNTFVEESLGEAIEETAIFLC